MKIVTASTGKKTLIISKKDWEAIGKKAGWERGKNCPRCGTKMGRHPNAEKAKKGYKNCPKCNMTYSPEGTKYEGSWAWEEEQRRKGKSGEKKAGTNKTAGIGDAMKGAWEGAKEGWKGKKPAPAAPLPVQAVPAAEAPAAKPEPQKPEAPPEPVKDMTTVQKLLPEMFSWYGKKPQVFLERIKELEEYVSHYNPLFMEILKIIRSDNITAQKGDETTNKFLEFLKVVQEIGTKASLKKGELEQPIATRWYSNYGTLNRSFTEEQYTPPAKRVEEFMAVANKVKEIMSKIKEAKPIISQVIKEESEKNKQQAAEQDAALDFSASNKKKVVTSSKK